MIQAHRLLTIALAGVAFAAAQVDPPGRVARLSHIDGSVSFAPAGVDEWVPATVNRPLTTGDRLWSDNESRAELHIGSSALRLAARTAFQFLNLDDRNVQVKLTDGTLSVHLNSLAEDETFEVDTPNLSFMLLRPGDYRIDAEPDFQTTAVTVHDGQGEVTGRDQAFSVRPNEQARITGDDSITYDVTPAPATDGWDQWCADRTRRESQSESARYISQDVTGYEDLDGYGRWSTAPGYGTVWTPSALPVGWAPYRYGHWAWIEPWGWTWVDDAPWGFAPFHYGRWAYWSGAWVWVPGPVAVAPGGPVVRPVYSPALVAWVGGAHWSVSFSIGGGAPVGWVPLGPREVYVPAYHASPTYITRVNTTNTVVNNINVTNIYNNTNVTRINYVNQTAPNAVTAVPSTAMASARPVNQFATSVGPQQLASAQVLSAAPVVPQREGVLGRATMAAPSATPPSGIFQRQVVARTTPPPAAVPFAQQRSLLEQNPGRPLDASAMQQLRSNAPAAATRPQVVQATRPQPAATSTPGWRQPSGPAPQSQPADAGWRRFDDRPGSPQTNRTPTVTPARPTPATTQTERPASLTRPQPAQLSRSESGERTVHQHNPPQQRKAEPHERSRGENK